MKMFQKKLENIMSFILYTSKPYFLFFVLFVAVDQVKCLNFGNQGLNNSVRSDLKINGESNLSLQVTTEARGVDLINFGGRILHKSPSKLWSMEKGEEDLVFTKDLYGISVNSYGDHWLGNVNETANGLSCNNIVQMAFDNKDYSENLGHRHVGIYNNCIYWKSHISLGMAFILTEPQHYPRRKALTRLTRKPFRAKKGKNTTLGPNTLVPVSYYYFPPDGYDGFSAPVTPSTSPIYVIPSWVWAVLSITGAITIFMIVNNIYWLIKKGRDQDQDGESSLEHQIEVSILGPKKYQLNELKSATNNFSAQNEIGRGGFGIVYKGTLRGKAVAVKRTTRNDQHGRKNMIAEVTTIGSLHHKNLVKLFGWCCKSNELLLVYEYMPNGSLDNLLHGNQTTLSWERRYNIVRGVAHSIDYLQNGCSRRVLHRDIKTSNIMLDPDFNVCLGDFGLARMYELSENTYHTTQEIAGTRAYMAPEIFLTGKATTQTDVYAFGVLALEVACGKRPRIQTTYRELGSIVEWVWGLYKQGMIYSVVDPKLNESYDKDEAECVILIYLACCHPDPRMRPSVRSALQALMGEILPPSVPLEKPDFVWPSAAPLSIKLDDHLISGGILSSLSLYAR